MNVEAMVEEVTDSDRNLSRKAKNTTLTSKKSADAEKESLEWKD